MLGGNGKVSVTRGEVAESVAGGLHSAGAARDRRTRVWRSSRSNAPASVA